MAGKSNKNSTQTTKDINERHGTKGGGTIRIERWVDANGNLDSYNMAYSNPNLCSKDKGRVVGYDDAHFYPGFQTKHHMHWFGGPAIENKKFVSFDDTLRKFQRILRMLKHHYKKAY